MRSSQKKRNTFDRKRKPFIVLAAEGKNKTERMYFTEFGKENKRKIQWALSNYTDPEKMAQALEEKCKEIEWMPEIGDVAYCLIDSDFSQTKNIQIKKAEQSLSKFGMRLLVSSPCFEVWYLCHYHLNEAKNIKVSVSYEADFNTREGMHIPDDVNEKEVLDAFIEEKSAFICMIFSRCALIIAQLTSAVGQPPIITPGVYIEA